MQKLTGKSLDFHNVDLLDIEGLRKVVNSKKFDAVIHFAALKAVGESVSKPLLYYRNNITGTTNLLEVLEEADVRNFVFSSSATVYGCLLYTSPSPRDRQKSRMPSSA